MSVGDRCSKAPPADGLASPQQSFRRKVVIALGAGAFGSWIDAAFAQPGRKPVKVGILSGRQPDRPAPSWRVFKDAMRDLGWVEQRDVVYVERFYAGDVRQAESLAAGLAAEKVDGLIVPATPLSGYLRQQIIDHAARLRLPAIYSRSRFVTSGGLMSYATDFSDNFRRAAGYVNKILKGAKPADLPVQQPTKFELVINMKTVKALGLKIPPEIMVRVDRVIE